MIKSSGATRATSWPSMGPRRSRDDRANPQLFGHAWPPPSSAISEGRSPLAPSSAGPLEPQLAPHPAEVVGWPALQALAGREILHVLEERDDLGAGGLEV